jgi:uncharacterized protein (TIGR02611 family)
MKEWFRSSWKKTPRHVRKPLVFVLGFTIVATGIVLLPLPGPGWLVIFAGFAILATEFEFAERIKTRVITFLKHIIELSLTYWGKITGKKPKK